MTVCATATLYIKMYITTYLGLNIYAMRFSYDIFELELAVIVHCLLCSNMMT